MHSFDDPHGAPYLPTWPYFFESAVGMTVHLMILNLHTHGQHKNEKTNKKKQTKKQKAVKGPLHIILEDINMQVMILKCKQQLLMDKSVMI